MQRAGFKDPQQVPCAGINKHSGIRKVAALQKTLELGKAGFQWTLDTDPEVFTLAANVKRRHLNTEQKREAIAAYAAQLPQASNREIARTLGVSDKTVGAVRRESVRNAEIPQSGHLPIERAKAAFRTDPTLSARAVAVKAGVGKTTAYEARQELIKAGEIALPAKARARKSNKPTAGNDQFDALLEKFKAFWSRHGGAFIEAKRMPDLFEEFSIMLGSGSPKEVKLAWARFSPTISSKAFKVKF